MFLRHLRGTLFGAADLYAGSGKRLFEFSLIFILLTFVFSSIPTVIVEVCSSVLTGSVAGQLGWKGLTNSDRYPELLELFNSISGTVVAISWAVVAVGYAAWLGSGEQAMSFARVRSAFTGRVRERVLISLVLLMGVEALCIAFLPNHATAVHTEWSDLGYNQAPTPGALWLLFVGWLVRVVQLLRGMIPYAFGYFVCRAWLPKGEEVRTAREHAVAILAILFLATAIGSVQAKCMALFRLLVATPLMMPFKDAEIPGLLAGTGGLVIMAFFAPAYISAYVFPSGLIKQRPAEADQNV